MHILGTIRLTYCKIWCFCSTYKQSSILRQRHTLTQNTAAEFQGISVSPSSETYPQALYSLTMVAETGMWFPDGSNNSKSDRVVLFHSSVAEYQRSVKWLLHRNCADWDCAATAVCTNKYCSNEIILQRQFFYPYGEGTSVPPKHLYLSNQLYVVFLQKTF
jgi:hypothetical protein